MSALRELGRLGQSFWIDFIHREFVTSGGLARMIQDDGLKGMTSNPAIFEQAMGGGGKYAAPLREHVLSGERDPKVLYERLAVEDVCMAADGLRGVYDGTEGRDGYVSLEVSPHLAHETEATDREARRLWGAVGRPNVMIKVPGTEAGFPAIESLVADGINVNVTLLFSHEAYARAADAYQRGLERRVAKGRELARVASVASFFVSRIDSAVDVLLASRAEEASGASERDLLFALGKVAVAWSKLAYRRFQQSIAQPRWGELERAGARPQRLLWASTSVKNPQYRDVLYVEELIGPDTVSTLPPATIDAFREHGIVAPTLTRGLDEAEHVVEIVARAGISMQEVTERLLADGVDKFVEPFDALLETIGAARDSVGRSTL